MRILLIGPPASGKGTQGKRLAQHLEIPFVSMGQILRKCSESSPYYETIHEYMDRGELVPYQIAGDLLRERVLCDDCNKGFVLDGWCRRMKDVRYFDPKPDKVIVFTLSEDSVIKRISGRRICTSDNKEYNIYTLPKEELKKCTGDFIQRDDDSEEVAKARLDSYQEETLEVINHFEDKGIVIKISAEPLPDEIFKNILSALKIAN